MDLEQLQKQNAELLQALRAFADAEYCRYIEQMRRDECLGVEYKLMKGRFGLTELAAHNKAAGHLAVHRAMHQFASQHRPTADNAGAQSEATP